MARHSIGFDIGNGSDVGCVREHNEDSFVCMEPTGRRQRTTKGYLLAVCDGMGGAVGGKTASTIAAEAIPEVYYSHRSHASAELLAAAIEEANARIFRHAEAEPELKGMGTTAVVVALAGNLAHVAHVGDSRCYLVRDGSISRVTQDHTMVNRMVADGLLTPEQAENHPESHILSRSVGVAAETQVDMQPPLELQHSDVIVLCSDGLSGQVSDDEILKAVTSLPPQEAVNGLIDLAKQRGGPDNVTVQVVKALEGKRPRKDPGTTTMMAMRPKRGGGLKVFLIIILLLLIAAGTVGALWLYEVVDFKALTGLGWIPIPPETLPPLK